MIASDLLKGQYKLGIIFLIALAITTVLVYLAGTYIGQKTKLDKLFNKSSSQLATGGWANLREYKEIMGNKDGLAIGKTFRISEKKSFEHCLLVGPNGSGKSASYFIPNILLAKEHSSMVITDPKGELFQKTGHHILSQRKNIMIFAPYESNTMRYNPLAMCRDENEVNELAETILKASGDEGYWVESGIPLLTAFMLFVKDLPAPKNTVSYALDLITQFQKVEEMHNFLNGPEGEPDPYVDKYFRLFATVGGAENQLSGIKNTMSTSAKIFANPMIERVTSSNDIDFLKLRIEPTVLFLMVPEHRSEYMAPLMVPLYKQLFNYLLENKGCPVYFLLDELANIGKIDGLDKYLSTIRSREISVTLGIQSVNQLELRYGKSHQTILDQAKTKVVLPGLSYQSAKYFADSLGFEEIVVENENTHGTNENKQRRQVLDPDEVRRIPDGKLIVLSDNKRPYKDKQNRYYQVPELLALTEHEMDLKEFLDNIKGTSA